MVELEPGRCAFKTGGTTGASSIQIKEGVIGQIARGDFPRPRILTPSAPGKIAGDPTSEKLTHHAQWAEEALKAGNPDLFDWHTAVIAARFLGIVADLNLNPAKYERLLEQYRGSLELHVGHEGLLEIIQGNIMADFIPNAEFVWPDELVAVDQYGRIMGEQTKAMTRTYLRNAKDEDKVLIVVPHNGRDKRGHMLELTRNCGDAVGANMARAIKAPYVIFGSTDGIYSIDPERYADVSPRKREKLTFKELHTATQGGAYVVHIEGIVPIEEMEDGHLEVRHNVETDKQGTDVEHERDDMKTGQAPRLLAGDVGNRSLNFVRKGRLPEEYFEQLVTAVLREMEIPAKRITTDAHGATAIIDRSNGFTREERTKLRKDTGAESVEIERGVGMITIVGEDFVGSYEATGLIGKVLSDSKIKHDIFDTGRGSGKLVIVKKPEDFERAMKNLHTELIEGEAA
ncbi:hypothetical protein A3G67_01515 [Candidatus Roizmanbacteria bacterium RIFCSPLOWO2_12_FULL_40_12]|uniref:Uncharacterized protein n=1 Tax=Candidatus Roizmanbacteria bacterium RIFCSPLOWO2_01_FULL_40_42 TaxID=1802066 RepID=A0A1F7J6L1_9BACT|nr:MAG: hypothetical protein A2779_02420 [Candidatus Roizmanbacteria bacterium RIFCSPHIGHO2_01_FULL_40_98]OGK29075.1 MAG: hypothetical protein A3C31_03205 [Candidatus Roizmanbacteria bacterium RIFCSPHIGHO2_02_FULL_40_53]OGK29825.1 MAG: hypothetical protein A2W49_04620 [Candidatus Roizmanbacteria bacterium RIFCSPHIGHO2_12_41_18]OGK36216.1 MAG: hypothetical protein A3E69_01245 [Candidatus Roizmanbacteria bacterium RIFCSPHIGHO2_12_FULL_40_130]OGK51233.1 MAG: hypothetical protein A3B50_03375 [Candi